MSFAEEEDGKSKSVSKDYMRQAKTQNEQYLGRIIKHMKGSSFKDRRNDKAKERYSPLLKGKGKGSYQQMYLKIYELWRIGRE